MLLDFPAGTVWSQKHADSIDCLATAMFVPLSAFEGMPSQASRPSTDTAATTSSGGNSATDEWERAIAERMQRRPAETRQQAVVAVVRERPDLQTAYVTEYRQQVVARRS